MTRKEAKSRSSEFPILEDLGLYTVPTKGDGNCLFRALSDQVYGDETHHADLRDKIVNYVKQNSDHFAAFVGEFGESFKQYISRLAQDGVYGGHIEIVGFAEEFTMPVVIYQANNLYVVEPQKSSRSEWKLSAHIAYHAWEHYSSVRKIGGPQNGPSDIEIPQIGDIPSHSYASDSPGIDVPAWKVDIVMKSVPDADEATVTEMLRNKDYDQVIEELIMREYDGPQEVETPQNDRDDAPAENQAGEKGENCDEKEKEAGGANIKTTDRSRVELNETSKTPDEVEKKASGEPRSLTRKELAKQRRAERKERVRAKKTKGRQEASSKETNSSKANDAHKVILI